MTATDTLLTRSSRPGFSPGCGRNPITDDDVDNALIRFADRPLRHISFPYVEIEIRTPRPTAGTETATAVVSATGLGQDGRVEALAFAVGDVDGRDFWLEFLHGLRTRGLHGVRILAAPDRQEFRDAARTIFPAAAVRTIRKRVLGRE